jgi:hypothetical protein
VTGSGTGQFNGSTATGSFKAATDGQSSASPDDLLPRQPSKTVKAFWADVVFERAERLDRDYRGGKVRS